MAIALAWGGEIVLLCVASLVSGQSAEQGEEPSPPSPPSKALPLEGEVFRVAGQTAFLIEPPKTTKRTPTPWVWYAPTLPRLPGPEEVWMIERFLQAGIAVAGIDVGESYGSPAGRRLYSLFYEELTEERNLSRHPCLLARSRGGLMHYNWAVEHASSVACVVGIYPVCNLLSYPGLEKACGAYDMSAEQLGRNLTEHNPIDRLKPLAEARVPIYHLHGDSDTLVPLEENSGRVASRYRALGGEIILNVVPGQGHNMWSGWFECEPLVDFIIRHAR